MIKKIVLVSVVMVIISIITLFYQFDKALNTRLIIAQESFLHLEQGSSVSALAKKLVNKQWITTPLWLKAYARLFPNQINIKAGTYLIQPETSLLELISILVKGKEHQFSITFVEGTRFQDVLKQLKAHAYIKQTINDKPIVEIAKALNINESNPEGWLYPDTYAFTLGTKDITLLKRAHDNMHKKLQGFWKNRSDNLPYKTPYEALIMASIIEKETSYLAEQPLISSVFINRLRKNMRLQTDPTVIYGLGEQYKGDITRAHLREKTPYNTYRIKGLPPTPIALAGGSAIHATLNPAKSEYFYFVSGGNGKHVFNKTLAGHNKAVKQYLQQQKQLKTQN